MASVPLDLGILPYEVYGVSSEDELRIASEEAVTPLPTATVQEFTRPFGRGWAFDFEAGQFVKRGDSPAEVADEEQVKVWIEKALRTGKETLPIYSTRFGMNPPFSDFIRDGFTDAGQFTMMSTAIEQALVIHDRIESVSDFTYEMNDTLLLVSFRVALNNNTTLSMSMKIQ